MLNDLEPHSTFNIQHSTFASPLACLLNLHLHPIFKFARNSRVTPRNNLFASLDARFDLDVGVVGDSCLDLLHADGVPFFHEDDALQLLAQLALLLLLLRLIRDVSAIAAAIARLLLRALFLALFRRELAVG